MARFKQRAIIFLVCTACLFTYLFTINTKSNEGQDYVVNYIPNGAGNRTKFLVSDVNTIGCQIPEFDPFDASVKHLYKNYGPLVCPGPPSLLNFNQTHFAVRNVRAKERFLEEYQCFYKAITRTKDNDEKYELSEPIEINGPVKVKDEFIKIECVTDVLWKKVWNKALYTELLPFIQVKPEVENRCNEKFTSWTEETKDIVKERLSVTFVAIDSVSRLNMMRQMPKTYSFLKNKTNVIELQGFIKIADNTFVNIVPLLTGNFVEEVWNETMLKVPMDYLNLIWKKFSNKGYRTFWAEEHAGIAAFNRPKGGFTKQPTDYYMRPFNLAVDDSGVLKDNCYNSRPEQNVTLQWLMDFLTTFKTKPTFSVTFNSRLSHGDLNAVGYADDLHYDFFQQYWSNSLHTNSILVFFSDHGIRFGEIRNTYVGKIEERMPYVFMVIPQRFQEKYPEIWKNLKVNQNRITTFFDLHKTLEEILNFTGEAKKADINKRGLSLFSEVPQERTCEDAAILPHWCTCHDKISVSPNDSKVVKAAQKVIEDINVQLSAKGDKCAVLRVDKVVDARASGLSDKILRFQHSRNDVINRRVIYGDKLAGVIEYLLTILVKPSAALFEATVKYFEATNKYELSGDVSRINKYGSQSNCISSNHLRKFCFCT